MKKNIIVGQSGGPTAVINASLYGILKEGLNHREQVGSVYGMIHGIEGFLRDDYMDLTTLSDEDKEILKLTPAAYLGSCRFKLPEDFNSVIYPSLFQKFSRLNIGYFFYIGGNDSMDTVSKLSRYASKSGSDIRFIGIPKTIDNDLILTDHTPGYGSAAKYVANTVREIVMDASVYQQKAVTIVELMGRHAGWLTAAAKLARKYEGDNPLFIYLPESDFDMDSFIRNIETALERQPNVIVCVSEGISDSHGKFICEYDDEARLDSFGHKMLTGCGKVLENFVRNRLGVKVRSVELNVCQRCSAAIISETDIKEAILAASHGVLAALEGQTGKMTAFRRTSGPAYELSCMTVDVNDVCNKEKPFPSQWITKNGTDIGQEFLDYALPLIQGNVIQPEKDGLPVFLYR
ncbi:diphosphate--fructose-6-phosphate 1-phosphotransferase [Clostridium sp. MCC353]|uniref:6-phosphofructokinase n=1 Tax=Clostridium sp. MCC353 TaxID=2592646 RepID=UPI001C00C200|nr:6-phosphofructokinase [Clostridium sp. MCC353]MBT9778638.1 diphosphate--fructose-6-phosphate 1-phosphotransferase [Clostridium sp. MCC353]